MELRAQSFQGALDMSHWDPFDMPILISHEFEVDLNCTVVMNHKFTLDGITESERIEIVNMEQDLAKVPREPPEEREIAGLELAYQKDFYLYLSQSQPRLPPFPLITT